MPDPHVAQLEALAADLIAFSNASAEAREWGGPTIYPTNPFTEARAHAAGRAITAMLAEHNRLKAALDVFARHAGYFDQTDIGWIEILPFVDATGIRQWLTPEHFTSARDAIGPGAKR